MHYRLMNEYGVDWPVWDEDGPCAPGTPTLPPSLTAEVLAWAADFNERYSVTSGWPDEATARSHERQGHRLQRLVERELPPGDDVVLQHWETTRRRGR